MKGSTELRPAVRSGAGNRIPGFFRKLLAVSLVLALAACVSGREKLAGPDVRSLPTAMVKVLSTAPLAEVHDVVSGSNTVRVLVESSADPVGVVILFAGGRGVTAISDRGLIGRLAGNFLVRSRHLFWQHDYMTVVFDSPSYATEDLRPIHDGEAFAGDIAALIGHLRQTYKLPVWVIGTSRGTVAAANAASRLGKDSPDGVVFTASLFEGYRTADVFDLPLEDVRMPSLIVHHRQDGCEYTRPSSVAKFKHRLGNAKAVKVMWFEGGSSRGDACQASSYHGFRDIENSVVAKIAGWINNPVGD